MSRQCVFCDSPGPLTNEHVYRNKLRRILPVQTRYFGSRSTPTEDHVEINVSKSTFDRTVRMVCEPCNRGWMNELENEVEPVVSALMLGEPVVVGEAEATAVARWAAKTAMMRGLCDPGSPRMPPHAFRQIRDVGPPESWSVWIGRVDIQLTADRNTWGHIATAATGAERQHLQQTTVALGEFMFTVLAADGGGDVGREAIEVFRGHCSNLPLIRLWPDPEPFVAPISEPLSNADNFNAANWLFSFLHTLS